MSKSGYIEVDVKHFEHLFNGELILLVTATELETNATHKLITPINGYEKIVRVFEGDLTYYIGMFGKYLIVHVQTSMGSISRDSTIRTVTTAIDKLKSKIVIMVGVAFGVDDKKQSIGDVLISESIIPYNARRIGKDDITPRGIEASSNKTLLNRFKNINTTWDYYLPDGKKAKLIPARLLSGEELIDNLEYRNKLIEENPVAKGGEMEGVGIYTACDEKAAWILVKGICDFADGEKGREKKKRQTIAINSALSVCLEVFNSPSAFKFLNVKPSINIKPVCLNLLLSNNVLFDIYDKSKEPYYYERKEDILFNRILSESGLWVYGPTGCGKSNIIIRNLINNKKKYIPISLAGCIDMDIEAFFKEILYEISAKVGKISNQVQPKNFSECSKALIELLNKYYLNKEINIFIEEIPICNDQHCREFSGKLFSLLIDKSRSDGLGKVKFILSSINNPQVHLHDFQQKILENFKFMQLEYWRGEDILKLIKILENEHPYKLNGQIVKELIKTSNGSPRFVKKFFRNINALNKTDVSTLQYVLKETKRELNYFDND